jgi:hypothetical protein
LTKSNTGNSNYIVTSAVNYLAMISAGMKQAS